MGQIRFEHYQSKYYQQVCDFLIEINRELRNHANWTWARLEWMIEHPLTKKELLPSMGLWFDDEHIVGAALIDMFFGEAFVGVLPNYLELYPKVLEYAFANLKDDSGLGVAFIEDNKAELEVALKQGFYKTDGAETVCEIPLDKEYPIDLPTGFSIETFDCDANPEEISWIMYQGFDNGNDKEEFLKEYTPPTGTRPHFNKYLCIVIRNEAGEGVASASTWYDPKVDYAYLEPVCVIPAYRKLGLGKAAVYMALNHAHELGAKRGIVISDKEFYEKLGFIKTSVHTFYWKKEERTVNGVTYKLERLLGKGKGGYSYLAKANGKEYVLKQIHHEPCDYYKFGNKIEAEANDYKRLIEAGIRIPKMIAIDFKQEIVIKEYIEGEVISDLINEKASIEAYVPQVEEMARLAKKAGLNIDYYPTNFVVRDGLLYYIDYECNDYMQEWSLENWGMKFWR